MEVSNAADGRGTGTILVVDDEPMVCRVAERALEQSGFDVLTASDGLQAMNVFRERSGEIAAVLLDLTIPRVKGEEVFREMLNIRPDLPVILTSGYAEEDATERLAGTRPGSFLQKPFRTAELVQKMRALLEG